MFVYVEESLFLIMIIQYEEIIGARYLKYLLGAINEDELINNS